jgi:O-acetyl-ADP-ribose deacetylase (regulator of RNase III)
MTKKASISAVIGDIVDQHDCDGIVNSANEYLIAGSGVCGAIHKAAGPALEQYTRRYAPLELGGAIASPGFNLANRWVIHTRGPRYLQDPEPARYLAQAVRSAIRVAEDYAVERLAIPAVSTGVYGYPIDEAAGILVQTAFQETKCRLSLKELRFVLYSPTMYSFVSTEISLLR